MSNIILAGFMGSGKTSLGKRLSYQLRRTLIDTDRWIEQKNKMTVSQIFEKYGEPAFRRMETECLEELIESAHEQIISLGGGLPVRKENLPLLKQLGTVVYLKVTPQAVYERLKGDNTRPLLQVEDPLKRICQLMAERAPAYEACADITLEVSDRSFEDILQELGEKIKETEERKEEG